jgi:hypothetical protein
MANNKSLAYGATILTPADPVKKRSASATSLNGSLAPRRRGMPQYDSINDPHLRDYFEKKFRMSSAVIVVFFLLFISFTEFPYGTWSIFMNVNGHVFGLKRKID